MKVKYYMLLTLIVLFAGKYAQIAALGTGAHMLFFGGEVLLIIAMLFVAAFSVMLLNGNYRLGVPVLAAGAVAFIAMHMIFAFEPLYILSQILMVVAFFTLLFPLHHYETKKYPAFGSAFLMIYVLTEGTSLWRGQYNLVIFALYLTLSLSMYIPGIIKIKEAQ
ncbi:MAG: hypothetical protein GXO25_05375 [Euryarchaeota archaeon]|nr:hypothetical protein [Euryarchaeota archaeon]